MKLSPFFHSILIFGFWLGISVTNAQERQELSGYVVDRESGDPVPYALVGVPEQQRGISANINGFFRLYLPERNLEHHLQISSIGYQRLTVSLADINWGQEQRFQLDPKPMVLDEIVILGKSQTVDQLVKNVSKNRKKYLRSKPYLMNGFYREVLKIDGKYRGLTEGQGILFLNGYDAGYKNNQHHLTYDLVQWKHMRRSDYPDSISRYLEIASLLKTKDFYLHDGPLHKRNLDRLIYSITDSTVYKDRLVLEISFEPKENYRDQISYEGRMYVKEDDQALLGLAVVADGPEPYLNNALEEQPLTTSFEIRFFEFESDYYLSHLSSNRSYSYSNSDYDVYSELVGASFSGQQAMFLSYHQRAVLFSEMLNPLVNYDESFWNSFNFSDGADYQNMLESYPDLKSQFQNHHDHRLVPLPEGYGSYEQIANDRNVLDFLMQR